MVGQILFHALIGAQFVALVWMCLWAKNNL